MGNGYPIVQPNELAQWTADQKEVHRRLRELERPTGTQQNETVKRLIIPKVNSTATGTTAFTLTTSYASVASFTFTVPDGCTQALITLNGYVLTTTNASGGDRIFASFVTNGTRGVETEGIATNTFLFPTCSAFQSISLTGLTSGGTVSCALQAHLQSGPGTNTPISIAAMSGMALFLP